MTHPIPSHMLNKPGFGPVIGLRGDCSAGVGWLLQPVLARRGVWLWWAAACIGRYGGHYTMHGLIPVDAAIEVAGEQAFAIWRGSHGY